MESGCTDSRLFNAKLFKSRLNLVQARQAAMHQIQCPTEFNAWLASRIRLSQKLTQLKLKRAQKWRVLYSDKLANAAITAS